MLTKAQKQYLKGLGNTLNPLVQIGKNGLTDNVIQSVDDILTAHEICKVSVLNTCPDSNEEIAIEISRQLHCDIVSQLGRKIVFYRKSDKNIIKLK